MIDDDVTHFCRRHEKRKVLSGQVQGGLDTKAEPVMGGGGGGGGGLRMGRAVGVVQPLQPGICLLGFPITDPRGPGKEGGG
jgi:hypothetical protein